VSADEVFDEPSAWQVDAVRRLGLDGEDLIAGASTGVGYPDALEPVLGGLGLGAGSLVLDLGAGLGGVSQWVAERTGAIVVALEPERLAAAGADRLFPGLVVVHADAVRTPFDAGSFDAVTLFGLVSLVDDLDPLLSEVIRILRPLGRIGISDLFLSSGSVAHPRHSPNTFRSMDLVIDRLQLIGCDVVVRLEGATTSTRWDEVGSRVDDEITRRHEGSAALDAWQEDRRRIAESIERGEVHVGSVVAVRHD